VLQTQQQRCNIFIIYKSNEIKQSALEKFFFSSLTCERDLTIFSAFKYLIVKEDINFKDIC